MKHIKYTLFIFLLFGFTSGSNAKTTFCKKQVERQKTNILDKPFPNKLVFYPNPVTSYFELDLGSLPYVQFEIISIVGQSVLSGILSENNTKVWVEELPAGQYIIKCKAQEYSQASILQIK